MLIQIACKRIYKLKKDQKITLLLFTIMNIESLKKIVMLI